MAAALLLFVSACDFNPDFSEFNEHVEGPSERPDACKELGLVCTVAGVAGEAGFEGNGGPALSARLNYPVDIAMAPLTLAQTGEIYVLDWKNNAVRRITPDGSIHAFIGTGEQGDATTGDAGSLTLYEPTDLIISPRGDFFLTDWQNCKIKVVNAITLQTTDSYGTTVGLGGDGGPAGLAHLNLPSSFIFDPNGDMYISDQGNQRIRRIDVDGVISTFSGTEAGYHDGVKEGALFRFSEGEGLVPGGKLSMNTHDWAMYIADTENNRIRRINFFTGEVTTVAGDGTPGYAGDGGDARKAKLNRPTDVIFREDHHIYIADSGNHVIRKVDPFGFITTLVGTGEPGTSADGTPGPQAQLDTPMGIYYDETTFTLYIADTHNHLIKRIKDR
ncbi:MAG: hypothetical protein R2834_23960 [Rhodothermales bacterium]